MCASPQKRINMKKNHPLWVKVLLSALCNLISIILLLQVSQELKQNEVLRQSLLISTVLISLPGLISTVLWLTRSAAKARIGVSMTGVLMIILTPVIGKIGLMMGLVLLATAAISLSLENLATRKITREKTRT